MNCRRLLQVSALAGALALLPAVRAEDWPQWRGPERDGIWHETGVMESFPREGLPVAWRVPVSQGWSSPVVAQGRVYITDVQLTPPTARERVLCFDAATGNAVWKHEYAVDYPDWALEPGGGGGPRATPVVRDGKVYTVGAAGDLFCFDAAVGAVVWNKSLVKEYQLTPFSGITASPLIEDELLILYICGKPAACVVALEKKSGKEVWRALDDAFTYSSPITLTAGGQRQLIVWTQDAVTSLNPRTGATWWREQVRTPGDQAVSTPVVSGSRLFAGGLMMQLDSGKPAASVLWPETKAVARRILSNTSTALLQGECVYSAKTSGELVCLDAATGEQVWQTDTVTSLRNGSSIHLTPNGNSVFLFTDEGNLMRARLSSKGYQELGRVRLVEPTYSFNGRKVVWPPPAYADRHVFARNDKELICASLAVKSLE